mmetsp:Transcript_60875/g.141824  ORF Transcript_60875/g.141824 Transcript_60875/m.141824 type:complete len:208 (-) Transcript_60875:16-639(-)
MAALVRREIGESLATGNGGTPHLACLCAALVGHWVAGLVQRDVGHVALHAQRGRLRHQHLLHGRPRLLRGGALRLLPHYGGRIGCGIVFQLRSSLRAPQPLGGQLHGRRIGLHRQSLLGGQWLHSSVGVQDHNRSRLPPKVVTPPPSKHAQARKRGDDPGEEEHSPRERALRLLCGLTCLHSCIGRLRLRNDCHCKRRTPGQANSIQ